eukprot:TRINITY_DN6733_c0_g2_i1.p1 TRINITY_DN6733_c0_g2~~TRINITY_DN6733_c0_g2_i1.p1  ORF type:complete len:360 (-),score=74.87 TRINITY_DN6733_c0_g2_i1:38-1006(-)
MPTQKEHVQGWAVILRIHHVIADGVGQVALMNRLFCESPLTEAGSPYVISEHDKAAANITAKQHTSPLLLYGKAVFYSLHQALLPPCSPNSFAQHPMDASQQVSWLYLGELANIKEVARHYGGTVNTLVLACVNKAIADHFRTSGEPVPRIFRAMFAANLRAPNPERVEQGNRVGMLFVQLPLQQSDDRNAVLYNLNTQFTAMKARMEPFGSMMMVTVGGFLPNFINQPTTRYFSRRASMIFSTIPGPTAQMYWGGDALVGGLGIVPMLLQCGVGITVTSALGGMYLEMSADTSVMRKESLLACLQAAKAELAELSVAHDRN